MIPVCRYDVRVLLMEGFNFLNVVFYFNFKKK
jgi:hypothetical protein